MTHQGGLYGTSARMACQSGKYFTSEPLESSLQEVCLLSGRGTLHISRDPCLVRDGWWVYGTLVEVFDTLGGIYSISGGSVQYRRWTLPPLSSIGVGVGVLNGPHARQGWVYWDSPLYPLVIYRPNWGHLQAQFGSSTGQYRSLQSPY